jgi:hypothetical protein
MFRGKRLFTLKPWRAWDIRYGHGNIKYGIWDHTNASASLHSNPSLINHMMNPFPSFHKQEQLERMYSEGCHVHLFVAKKSVIIISGLS